MVSRPVEVDDNVPAAVELAVPLTLCNTKFKSSSTGNLGIE